MLNSIAVTEIIQFKACRRKWYYGYVERLRANTFNPNFFLGTAIHYALQKYYEENTKSINTLFKAYNSYVQKNLTKFNDTSSKELVELGANMLTTYWYYDQNQPTWNVKAVEQKLRVPIKGKDTLFTFMADLVIEEGGDIWIVDHKTAAQLRTNEGLALDYQMTAYCYGYYRATGIMPKGVIYNTLLKQLKELPVQLKDGSLSKNKTQKVTPEVYAHTVKKLGLNIDEYKDIIEHLQAKSPAVVRQVSLRTPRELEIFENFLAQEHADMQAVALDFNRAYINPTTFTCSYCEYLTICKEENSTGNTSFLKNNVYIKKEDKEDGSDFE